MTDFRRLALQLVEAHERALAELSIAHAAEVGRLKARIGDLEHQISSAGRIVLPTENDPAASAVALYPAHQRMEAADYPGPASMAGVTTAGYGVEPADPFEVDWSQAPEWAQWWAVDKNGNAHWHEIEPVNRDEKRWYQPQVLKLFKHDSLVVGNFDWRDSLRQRPQERDEYLRDVASKALAAVVDDADGWIEWNGGECPVPKGTLVDVRYRTGDENHHVEAGNWLCTTGSRPELSAINWYHNGSRGDIIAYRLHKPEHPAEPAPTYTPDWSRAPAGAVAWAVDGDQTAWFYLGVPEIIEECSYFYSTSGRPPCGGADHDYDRSIADWRNSIQLRPAQPAGIDSEGGSYD